MLEKSTGIVLTCLIAFVKSSDWSYTGEHGPSKWSEEATACDDSRQSPINIVTKSAIIDPNLQMLQLRGYGQSLTGGTFVNNGHSVQLNFPTGKTFTLSGAGLGKSTYQALQLHFHWASPGTMDGSEHTVDGKHYPVEMHIVHIKNGYSSTDEVKDMDDGLAVLGVFFDVDSDSSTNNPFQELLNSATKCTYAGSSATLKSGPTLISLLPESASFYSYMGSLTTPPCYETVAWTVLSHPIKISEAQLRDLQSLKSAEGPDSTEQSSLGGNYRPVQPLNGRLVTSYVDFSYREESHSWSYYGSQTGTSKWLASYPECGEKMQSPINIVFEESVKPVKFEELSLQGFDTNLKGSFINNGHAVQLNFDSTETYTVTGGGLGSTYSAVQLHFHWGEALSNGVILGGSEHTLNNRRFPAEMHIVHGKTSHLGDLTDYRNTASDAYLVLGVFIDVYQDGSGMDRDAGANENMGALIDSINEITFADDTAVFPTGPALSAILPKSKSFYRYNGSLTTPPCSQSVIWTVFEKPIQISFNQFVALERLFSSKRADVKEKDSIMKLREALLLQNATSRTDPGAIGSKISGKLIVSAIESDLLDDHMEEHLLRNNYRSTQNLNAREVTYYESNDSSGQEEGTSALVIVLGSIIVIMVLIILISFAKKCFCGNKNSTSYKAGHKARSGSDV